MKKLVAGLMIAAFAGVTFNAFAAGGHGSGMRDIDKDAKKQAKRQHKAEKAAKAEKAEKAEKTEKADDAKK